MCGTEERQTRKFKYTENVLFLKLIVVGYIDILLLCFLSYSNIINIPYLFYIQQIN